MTLGCVSAKGSNLKINLLQNSKSNSWWFVFSVQRNRKNRREWVGERLLQLCLGLKTCWWTYSELMAGFWTPSFMLSIWLYLVKSLSKMLFYFSGILASLATILGIEIINQDVKQKEMKRYKTLNMKTKCRAWREAFAKMFAQALKWLTVRIF